MQTYDIIFRNIGICHKDNECSEVAELPPTKLTLSSRELRVAETVSRGRGKKVTG
jgi:hypothetical protein